MSDERTAEAASSSKIKKLLLPVVAVLALAAGGLLGPELLGGEEAAAEAAPAPTTPADEVILEVTSLTANLAGPELHYGRVAFSVVLSPDALAETVTARFPLLEDAAIGEVTSMTPELLRSPEGLGELRGRLMARAQEVYPGGEVVRVVLTELMVQ